MRLENVNNIVIGLGSNLGDSPAYLASAVRMLEEHFFVSMQASSLYRSEPAELKEQPWFYNQVVRMELSTGWKPTAVLTILKEIEMKLGRKKSVRYGPRVIDLDLLFFGRWVLETSHLIIPHPKVEERAFVLYPLVELDPDFVNPRTGRKLIEVIQDKASFLGVCEVLEFGKNKGDAT